MRKMRKTRTKKRSDESDHKIAVTDSSDSDDAPLVKKKASPRKSNVVIERRSSGRRSAINQKSTETRSDKGSTKDESNSDVDDIDTETAKSSKKSSSNNKRKSNVSFADDDSDNETETAAKKPISAENKRLTKKQQKELVKKEKKVEYDVEKILDHGIQNGSRYFLIRWNGYDSDNDTWESRRNLKCPELIEKYYEVHPEARPKEKKSRKKKKVKTERPKIVKKDQEEGYKSDEFDENEDWEVEKILDVDYAKNGSRKFYIRWKGYSSKCDSWEPEANLNCSDLIEIFMNKINKITNVSPKDLREVRVPTQRYTLMAKSTGRRLSKRHGNHQRVVYFDTEL